MGAVDFARAKQVFLAAIELAAGDRAAFLDRECAGDGALRSEVERRLEQDDAIGSKDTAARDAVAAMSIDLTCSLGAGPEAQAASAGGIPRSIGQFALGDILGQGGFGCVYRARDNVLGRDVALKVLLPGSGVAAEAVEAFIAGVRATSDLRHPALVQTFHAGFDGSTPYLVLELVDGLSLAELLRRGGRLPEAQACAVLLDVCEGIGALHDAGIVHRDIKPANILLDRDGRAHVTDMGLAVLRPFGAPDGSGPPRLAGTPLYMAPEAFEGECTARTDVYALGITAFEILTGRTPFFGDLPDLVRRHREREIPALPLQEAGVSGAAIDIINRATAKRAAQRQRSANHLARDLEALAARTGSLARGRGAVARAVQESLERAAVGPAPTRSEPKPDPAGTTTLDALRAAHAATHARAGEVHVADAAPPQPESARGRAPLGLPVCLWCWYEVSKVAADSPCPECGKVRPLADFAVEGWAKVGDVDPSWWKRLGRIVGECWPWFLVWLPFPYGILREIMLGRPVFPEGIAILGAITAIPVLVVWSEMAKARDRVCHYVAGNRLITVHGNRVSHRPLSYYLRARVRRRGQLWELVVDRGALLAVFARHVPTLFGEAKRTCVFEGSARYAASVRSAFRGRISAANRRRPKDGNHPEASG